MTGPHHGAKRRIRHDSRGAAIVEFGILAPLIIAMMLGVFQIGITMHAYNALRSLAGDTTRYATVEYQKDRSLTDDQITQWAEGRAVDGTYVLDGNDLIVTTQTPATQRVNGARERTLTLSYTLPGLLSFIGVNGFTITYSRSIFVPA